MKFPIPAVSLLVVCFIGAGSIQAKPQKGSTPKLSKVEASVLESINRGDTAYLFREEETSDETVRLGKRFVEELLMGTLPGLKPHRNGVQIQGAVIEEPIDLSHAEIHRNVEFRNSEFYSVSLEGTHFFGNLTFFNCTFNATASFDDVSILGLADFSESRFKARASFVSSNFSSGAAFDKTTFEKQVSFSGSDFSGQLSLTEAHFDSPEIVSFNPLKVKGPLFLRKTVFIGAPDFLADTEDDVDASEAEFKKKTGLVWLDFKSKGKGFFNKTKFYGPVAFEGARFTELSISEGNPPNSPVPNLNLSRLNVAGQLVLRDTEIKVLTATSVRVTGPVYFTNLRVSLKADLSYSQFTTLDIANSSWPDFESLFRLRGMKYDHINADSTDELQSHNNLLNLAAKSAYSADVYKNLENFFLNQGYRDDADRAFIAGKERERKDGLSGLLWLGSWSLFLLVGYGRHPVYAGVLCAAFILAGCLLFPRNKMQLQVKHEKGDPPRVYNRFWYSLGLFLPFVDLNMDRLWKPKASCTFRRHYVRVHILAGWVFVPIFLAALTGLIK